LRKTFLFPEEIARDMLARPEYKLVVLIAVLLIITFFLLATIFRTHDVNIQVTLGIVELLILVYFTFAVYNIDKNKCSLCSQPANINFNSENWICMNHLKFEMGERK
jgi:hypothetical protein